ncbi:MAG: M20/M25/M40 family metallo-hydrolase [Anaerolineales bacterium]|nr:M20/M25/M40 family metallo-hydrolase [Anaerolineales bacterium]
MTSKQNTSKEKYHIAPRQMRLLEKLCMACAVSGDESQVRTLVLEHIRPIADEVRVDAMGNVLATRKGEGKDHLRVMVAAHMDEVGFMITHEDDKETGFFRFDLVGGIDVSALAGKPILVGKDRIPGVIGAKPIHLSTVEERKRDFTLEDLRIDVGPGNNKKVKIGDRATFASEFIRQGDSLRTKALDDRLGVAALIELLKNVPDNIELLAAFTVQEEVGLRGARVAAYTLDPQAAIVLDCTPARDLPVWQPDNRPRQDNTIYNTHLGAGPAIYIADSATLSDPRLVQHLINTAQALDIPYQIRQPGRGGTDAGAIHVQKHGIPTVSLSTPARYLHSGTTLVRLSDWANTCRLIQAALERMTPDILKSER